ncbi:ribosomal protein S16 domain-containing protein [Entophlyctis helioformis]|nr:ribosomal protein S16 domain-containing protein [Entophlyctis helioformis]
MVVRIRLARWGAANNPFYGIVVANARAARDGKHLERVGTYNSVPDENRTKHLQLNVERIKHWLAVGAQPSERVSWLLAKAGIMPPTPKQLQNEGFVSFADHRTWDVVIKDEAGAPMGIVSMKDAIDQFGNTALAKHLPLKPSEILTHNIKDPHITLDGKAVPKEPLSGAEALRVLKAYAGIV